MASPLVAVTMLRATEDGDYRDDWQASLKVTLPETPAKEFRTNFSFVRGSSRHRLFQRFEYIPFEKPGDVQFELLINGQHLAEHHVTLLPAAAS